MLLSFLPASRAIRRKTVCHFQSATQQCVNIVDMTFVYTFWKGIGDRNLRYTCDVDFKNEAIVMYITGATYSSRDTGVHATSPLIGPLECAVEAEKR